MELLDGLPIVHETRVSNVIYVRYLRSLTDEEQVRYLEASERSIVADGEGGARRVMIFDTAFSTGGSSLQRKRQSDWQGSHRAYFERTTVCGIFIAPSRVIRGALTAMSWAKAFPFRLVVVSDFEGALAAVAHELESAKLPKMTPVDVARLQAASRFKDEALAAAR